MNFDFVGCERREVAALSRSCTVLPLRCLDRWFDSHSGHNYLRCNCVSVVLYM
jgi:hypothetical protein